MASISNDPNGRRRILFLDCNKKRQTIRLGKCSKRFAESVKVRVEELAVSVSIGPPQRINRRVAGEDRA